MSKITLDNFSDNLIAYLNEQISAAGGSELIGDINGLNTTNKTTIVGAINELVQICSNLTPGGGGGVGVKTTSDSFAIVDINTKGIVSNGSIMDDIYASHGRCYSGTSSNNNIVLYSADFNEVKFGNYALCLRIKLVDGSTSGEAVKATIYNGSAEIMTKSFAVADFETKGEYQYLYSTFEYNGDGKTKSNLKLKIEIPVAASGTTKIQFDYAYISMIIPSIFL